jgi:hypothetical protein
MAKANMMMGTTSLTKPLMKKIRNGMVIAKGPMIQ